jgi:hypothetical protein
MTEDEWLACTDPEPMLAFLRGKTSDRKLRLFACACLRWAWGRLEDARSREAVEVSERYADGLANQEELAVARQRAWEAHGGCWRPWRAGYYAAAAYATDEAANLAAAYAAPYASSAFADASILLLGWRKRKLWMQGVQSVMVRDLFRNRFHLVLISPAWQTPQAVALAQAAYDQRELPSGTLDTALLAIRADALEEAGCDDPDILAHCRQPSVHVRGCWAVDLLLGKE